MGKIKGVSFDMGLKGRARPKMSKADKDFIKGYAACLSAAISTEDWRPSQIGGGISVFDYEFAGVEKRDLDIIRGCKE